MSNHEWAKKELEFAGYPENDPEDGPNKWLREGTLELLEVFAKQGHSGFSAAHAIRMFTQLANWKPLTPLTGADDEWMDVDDDTWQNRRDGTVFKTIKRGAYWLYGIVFWEWFSSPDIYEGKPYKVYFTGSDSLVPVVFPWTRPEQSEYVFRPSEEYPHEEITV